MQDFTIPNHLKDKLSRLAVKGPRYVRNVIEDPRWAFTFLFGRFYALRQLSRQISAPARHRRESSMFGMLDSEQAVRKLRRDGLYDQLTMPINSLNAIRRYAFQMPANANQDSNLTFLIQNRKQVEQEIGKSIVVADYSNPEQCFAIQRLLSDGGLRRVASEYIGSEVTPSCRMWWSFPSQASRTDRLRFAQGTFHYDPDVDFRALKFFFCLTDVDSKSGLHEVIVGSHRKKRLRHLLTLFIGQSDSSLKAFYGERNIRRMACKAGQGFAEDPMCFHKGNAPIDAPRLMLEIVFKPDRQSSSKETTPHVLTDACASTIKSNRSQQPVRLAS